MILRHGGEAQAVTQRVRRAVRDGKAAIFEFLNTLVLFPPDDTASNLDPGDPARARLSRSAGHGSIRLPELFNDPTDLE